MEYKVTKAPPGEIEFQAKVYGLGLDSDQAITWRGHPTGVDGLLVARPIRYAGGWSTHTTDGSFQSYTRLEPAQRWSLYHAHSGCSISLSHFGTIAKACEAAFCIQNMTDWSAEELPQGISYQVERRLFPTPQEVAEDLRREIKEMRQAHTFALGAVEVAFGKAVPDEAYPGVDEAMQKFLSEIGRLRGRVEALEDELSDMETLRRPDTAEMVELECRCGWSGTGDQCGWTGWEFTCPVCGAGADWLKEVELDEC